MNTKQLITESRIISDSQTVEETYLVEYRTMWLRGIVDTKIFSQSGNTTVRLYPSQYDTYESCLKAAEKNTNDVVVGPITREVGRTLVKVNIPIETLVQEYNPW